MENENSIQEQCLSTYNKNMEFFEKHFPSLEKKITTFNKAIELNMYTPIYEIEYKEDGYFDIYNTKEKYYYYNKNSYTDAKDIVENYKFDEKNSFKNTYDVIPPESYTLSENLDEDGINYLYPLYKYINKHSQKDIEYKTIEKFIFVGTGLGTHIPKFAKKLNSKSYLIIEPNLEIFRLSLFVTDYSSILKHPEDLFFSVSEIGNEFQSTFIHFYNKFILLNYRFKFYCITELYHEFFDLIANTIKSKDPLMFNYSVQLKTAKRTMTFLKDGYKYLSFHSSLAKEYPACLVAPGPSLEKGGIEWLKKNHEKYLIIAVGAALKKLEKHQIKPDIITSVDPHDVTKNQFELENENFLKDSIFICSSNTHPDIVKKFKKENVYFYPIIFSIVNRYQSALGGMTIGEITYAITMLLGIDEIYLFGTDVALDPESGATHSKEHIHYKTRELKKTSLKEFNTINKDDTIEVPGNLREKVFTTRTYYSAILNYNHYSAQLLNENRKVFNTADGAKLKDIEPIHYDDIDTINKIDIDKKDMQNILKERFDKFSQSELSEDNINDSQNDIKVLRTIIKGIKKYEKMKFRDYDQFQYHRLGLIIENTTLSKQFRNNFIAHIINSYSQTVDNIIFNFFDKNPNVKTDKSIVNGVNNYWLNPYKKIYTFIEKLLIEFINKKS